MTTAVNLDPAVRVSRNMTPAFAHGSVLVSLTTRAVMVPSPVSACESNWKESAVPQISTPDPFRVYVLPLTDDEPFAPTLPTSPPVKDVELCEAVATLRIAVGADTLAGT